MTLVATLSVSIPMSLRGLHISLVHPNGLELRFGGTDVGAAIKVQTILVAALIEYQFNSLRIDDGMMDSGCCQKRISQPGTCPTG